MLSATVIGRSFMRQRHHVWRTTMMIASDYAERANHTTTTTVVRRTQQQQQPYHRSFATKTASKVRTRNIKNNNKNVRRGKNGKILPTKRQSKLSLFSEDEEEDKDDDDDDDGWNNSNDDDDDDVRMLPDEARAEAERRSEEAVEYMQRAQRDKSFMKNVLKEWEQFKDRHPQVREMEREGIDPWDIDPDDVQLTHRLRDTDKDMKELLNEPPTPDEVAEANAFFRKHGVDPDEMSQMRHVGDVVEDELFGGKEADDDDADKLMDEYKSLRSRMGLPEEDPEIDEIAREAEERMLDVKAKEERLMKKEAERVRHEREESGGTSPTPSLDKLPKVKRSIKTKKGRSKESSTMDAAETEFSKHFPPPVDLRAGSRKQRQGKGGGSSNNKKKKKQKD